MRLAFLLRSQNEKRNDQRDDGGGTGREEERPTLQVEVRPHDHRNADQEHVDDGQRNQEMPAEAHQLVESVAREGEAQPHEEVNVQAHFEDEPECPQNAVMERFHRRHKHRRNKD